MAAACGDPTGPPQLTLRVQGTVTTTEGDPIEDMAIGLGWESSTGPGSKLTRTDAEGAFAVALEDVFCAPGAFGIIGVIPDGYQIFFPPGDGPDSVDCTEAIQTFDILLEPVSD